MIRKKGKNFKRRKIVEHVSSDEEAELDYIQNINEEDGDDLLYYITKQPVIKDLELDCEKRAIKSEKYSYKCLLPIKKDGKIIPVLERKPIKLDDQDFNSTYKTPNKIKNLTKESKNDNLNFLELYDLKKYLSRFSSFILENPNDNIGKMSKLIRLLTKKTLLAHSAEPWADLVGKSLIISTITELFIDIIPAYKIRIVSHEEREQMVTKEVRALRNFEETLILNYKKYIQIIISLAKSRTQSKHKKLLLKTIIKSLGDLITKRPNFNYHINLIKFLVNVLRNKNEEILKDVCNTFGQIFVMDETNDLSLMVVRALNQFIKTSNYNVKPQVLDVFLSLKLDDINSHVSQRLEQRPEESSNKTNGYHPRKFLSRKLFKKSKAMEKFKKDMAQTEAVTHKKGKHQNDTEIANLIFTIYFKILQHSSATLQSPSFSRRFQKLLSAVLKGLSTFALLINIEFFHDLIESLYQIAVSPLTNCSDKLHSIITAFTILGGQYEATFNIDLNRFYAAFYLVLNPGFPLSNDVTENESIKFDYPRFTLQEVYLVAKCIETCFMRKAMLFSGSCSAAYRISAFVNRIALLILNLTSELDQISNVEMDNQDFITQAHITPSFIFVIILVKLIQTFPHTLHLFDTNSETKSTNFGACAFNMYIPDAKDPDFCQANYAISWEYTLLAKNYVNQSLSKYLMDNLRHLNLTKLEEFNNNNNKTLKHNNINDNCFNALIKSHSTAETLKTLSNLLHNI